MRKRVIAILLSVVCMLSLGACGAADFETVSQTEEVIAAEAAETNEPETESGETENVEATEAEEGDAEAEEAEPEESVITWYMDEEGIKNDGLGMMIRKDNGVMIMGLFQHMMVYGEGIGHQQSVSCEYYEGSLDNYVVQNSWYEKTVLGEYECALGKTDYDAKVVFVGNGIALELSVYLNDLLENESIEDYLLRMNLQPCDEFSQDCLAYLADDGLYCPALGISVTYNKDGDRDYGNEIWTQRIHGSNYDLPHEGCYSSLSIDTESYQNDTDTYGIGNAQSAEEALKLYVASQMEPDEYTQGEYTEMEGTVETSIAGYQYLGGGVIYTRKDEWFDDTTYEWLFCSDDVSWVIWLDTEDDNYEPYLSIIEAMP